MLVSVLATVTTIWLSVDTVVVLGVREHDMTGDGASETLRVVGVGESLDNLGITFSIESHEGVLYSTPLSPMTRVAGYDGGRRTLSDADILQRLADFESFFFADAKFQEPAQFVQMLRDQAPRHISFIPGVIVRDRRRQVFVDSLMTAGVSMSEAMRRSTFELVGYEREGGAEIWEEIQAHGSTVFRFSPGGDGLLAIAWSQADQRFYRLWECC